MCIGHHYDVIDTDKPNHNLHYEIGTDFCLENPSSTNVLLRIDCPLEREPLPEPIYNWTMILNETEVNLKANSLRSLGVHTYSEDSPSIDLDYATIGFRNYTTITIKCMVENSFGNDTQTTTISICSMLIIIIIIMYLGG